MSSLSDKIESYLRKLIRQYEGEVEIKRNRLADDFNCAPSQINYVLDTRFTVERGFIIESRRGGGGYVRIIKVKLNSKNEAMKNIIKQLEGPLQPKEAKGIIKRLHENNLIRHRDRVLLEAAISKNSIGFENEEKNKIRAQVLKNTLKAIFKI
ncbi:MAG TPA: CtsR family transcriptional regulator [Halanaerobiales bacterium]|nr:CtsR family transcriptional regulator [Halanaerobiales bacterium]